MTFAKRVDRNQSEIVEILRALGASVFILSEVGKGCPDILIGLYGQNFLAEIKDGAKPLSQQKLTESELKFFDTWKGQVTIIRSINDVYEFVKKVKFGEKKYG